MNDIAIRIENLGKQYRIGREVHRSTLRDVIMSRLAAPLKKSSESAPTFWALDGLDFEVKRGEVLGIIGRNGAGKSTLLKILSRITDPTRGKVEINGRVGSLLEVGTGFHHELTGRENIYLNGAILGMRRAEIDARLDRIIAFAEIGKFLDTTVKHYSSGMYTRLGFAVAAHLEPEILIVDEVLAVGDAQFQQKCMGRMSDVAREGRTVLFVSHNLSAIQNLCQRAIWLDAGKLRGQGDPREVTAAYLSVFADVSGQAVFANETCRLDAVEILGDEGSPAGTIVSRDRWGARIRYTLLADRVAGVMVRICNTDGAVIFESHETVGGGPVRPAGSYQTEFDFGEVNLAPGQYTIGVFIMVHHVAVYLAAEHCRRFAVIGTLIDSTGGVAAFDIRGMLNVAAKISTQRLP